MTDSFVLEIARESLQVSLMVAAPMLAASLLVGILVSLAQVATSIQDATLTFVPKILAVGATLLICGAWMIRTLLDFTKHIFDVLPKVLG